MNPGWDYASLSKIAQQNGGPEEFVKKIRDISFSKGMQQGALIGGFVGVVAGGVMAGMISYIAKYLREQKEKSEKELEVAEKELLEGIKEYDNSHE